MNLKFEGNQVTSFFKSNKSNLSWGFIKLNKASEHFINTLFLNKYTVQLHHIYSCDG